MTARMTFFIAAMIAMVLGSVATPQAAERIDIAPRRIILEPRERSSEITLLNLGDKDGTFRIEILNYRQDENGTYTRLDAPLDPAFPPEDILRLSPRQFTLPSGGRQKVRFSIRKPAELPDGEYRFHILATRMSEFGPPAPVGEGEKDVGMIMNISTAIPVVVRHGSTNVTATLSNLHYVAANADGKPEMKFTINRTGNISTIGSIKAYWQAPGSEAVEIGGVTNVNVFTEISQRHVAIPLKTALQGNGTIRVVYMNDQEQAPYAEASLSR